LSAKDDRIVLEPYPTSERRNGEPRRTSPISTRLVQKPESGSTLVETFRGSFAAVSMMLPGARPNIGSPSRSASVSSVRWGAGLHAGGSVSTTAAFGLWRNSPRKPGSAFSPGIPETAMRNASAGSVRVVSMRLEGSPGRGARD
jgi:hypothetical protein